MATNMRRTERTTRSTSITGPVLEPVATSSDIPADLVEQGWADLETAWLWEGAQTYRDSLEYILTKYKNSGQLLVRHLTSLNNLVGGNDAKGRVRLRVQGTPHLAVVPSATGAAEPEPAQEPQGVSRLPFDPPLTATAIGVGWGFKTGSAILRFAREYADFPPVVTAQDEQAQWGYVAVAAWGVQHDTDIRAALVRSRKQPKPGEGVVQALTQRVAELEAALRTRDEEGGTR